MASQLTLAYRSCARITRREAKNFYAAFLMLPRGKRRAIYAVYAFCREADDIADGNASLSQKAEALKRLLERLRRAGAGRPEAMADLALSDAIERFSIDPADLDHVIDGVEMDLTVSRYATFAELRRYCLAVASAAGLAVLPVLIHGRAGVDGAAARERAVALGLGMQLANIVRDVREDLTRGRLYLPQEDLVRHGVTEDGLRGGELDERMRALLSFQVARARAYLQDGLGLVSYLPRRSRCCIALMAGIYARILDRLEARGYDVFSERIALPLSEKISLAIGTGLRAFFT